MKTDNEGFAPGELLFDGAPEALSHMKSDNEVLPEARRSVSIGQC
jgi:hypothetical protein